jgi:hypothetical protein
MALHPRPQSSAITNVGNCEPTHVGTGFWLMMNGVRAVREALIFASGARPGG